jgi:hypothetical protein
MAREKRGLHEGDPVWVSAKVARIVSTEDGKEIAEVTVIIAGTGHRETMDYDPESIRPRDAIGA